LIKAALTILTKLLNINVIIDTSTPFVWLHFYRHPEAGFV